MKDKDIFGMTKISADLVKSDRAHHIDCQAMAMSIRDWPLEGPKECTV